MRLSLPILTAALFVFTGVAARAVTLYTATAQTTSRFNPTNGGQANGTSYDDVFVATAGENMIHLDSISFGIRRIAVAGSLVPVDITFFVAEMTGAGGDGLGPITIIGSASLPGIASASVTQIITQPVNLDIPLNTAVAAGFGGLWIGMTFTGANRADANNGWRLVTPPVLGGSRDTFGFISDTTPFSLFNFGAPPAPVADFYLEVSGNLVVPEPASAGLLLLGGLACLSGRRSRRR